MIKLEHILKKGEMWDEPNRTILNTIDQKHFVETNNVLFHGAEVLDIGCGMASLKSYISPLCRRYLGIDNGLMENFADILADYEQLPFKRESFDTVLSLQMFPKNIEGIADVLQPHGYLVHQSTSFFQRQNHVRERASAYFAFRYSVEYNINVLNRKDEIIDSIRNVFLVWQKKG